MYDLLNLRVGLFIPLSQPRFLQKAHERGADAIVLDLEDGVSPERKREARDQLAAAAAMLREKGVPALVRVNADPALLADDLRACVAAGIETIVVPKQESAHTAAAAAALLGEAERAAGTDCATGMVFLVESPQGVIHAAEIAASPRCAGLLFGPEDYCAALGVPSAAAALRWPAQQIAVAARAHGLAALGLPGSGVTLDDAPAFEALAREARSMGFTGSLCVHPQQVAPIRKGFFPSPAEIAQARAVVQAAEAHPGQGAYSVAGRMVDGPVVAQARRLLEAAASQSS
jgi:citrate lyase subunit beta/citryl-CoA lyase